MESKTFIGATRKEAKDKATQWWATTKGLRWVSETEFAIGNEPDLPTANHWGFTIVFEESEPH